MTSERLSLIAKASPDAAAVLLHQFRAEVQEVVDSPSSSFELRAQAISTRFAIDARMPSSLGVTTDGRQMLDEIAEAFEADLNFKLTVPQRLSLKTALELFAVEAHLSGHIAPASAA